MMYLILREIHYEGIDNSYDIEDFTEDHETALEKLQGYRLINKRKNTTYSILKYDSPLLLTKEVSVSILETIIVFEILYFIQYMITT